MARLMLSEDLQVPQVPSTGNNSSSKPPLTAHTGSSANITTKKVPNLIDFERKGLPIGMKTHDSEFDNFDAKTVDLKASLTTEDLCHKHPNHVWRQLMFSVVRAGLSANQIYAELDVALQRLLDKCNQPHAMYGKRLKEAWKMLEKYDMAKESNVLGLYLCLEAPWYIKYYLNHQRQMVDEGSDPKKVIPGEYFLADLGIVDAPPETSSAFAESILEQLQKENIIVSFVEAGWTKKDILDKLSGFLKEFDPVMLITRELRTEAEGEIDKTYDAAVKQADLKRTTVQFRDRKRKATEQTPAPNTWDDMKPEQRFKVLKAHSARRDCSAVAGLPDASALRVSCDLLGLTGPERGNRLSGVEDGK